MRTRQTAKQRRGVLLPVLLCILVLLLALSFVGRVDKGVTKEQTAQLKQALTRAAVTCYAIEGRYPPTLDYLYENYGVEVDASRFFVTYDVLGGNIMPTIAVLRRGEWK